VPSAPVHAQTISLFHDFHSTGDGFRPQMKMVQMPDGTFYGTTLQGGAHYQGTIFKITPAGQFQTIHQWGDTPDDGLGPSGNLLIGPDGNIYGTTQGGGSHQAGTVYKLTPGGALSTLYSFGSVADDGSRPVAGLTYVAADGNFYGNTYSGGASGNGTVFKISLAGAEQVIKSFDSSASNPESGLCLNPADGLLYGTTDTSTSGYGSIFKISTAGVLTTVQNLTPATGTYPFQNGMVAAADGSLYGALEHGGANDFGTIYKITSGAFSTVYSFDEAAGKYPIATMVAASDGALYGTATGGGLVGAGTIFKFKLGVSPVVTPIYTFTGSADGAIPGELMQASNGLLYGGSFSGGAPSFGSIFNITTNGSFFLIKDLAAGFQDGTSPNGRLLLGQDGNWYGTTMRGGLFDNGTIFTILPDGTCKILYNFNFHNDILGYAPTAGLIQAPDGTFYGSTSLNSTFGGVIFKFTVSGNPQVATVSPLYTFDKTHGAVPDASLLLGSDGNLYGTTYNGGANDDGVVFKLTPAGVLTVLRTFAGTNGANPTGALVQGPDGALYGTTSLGGVNCGVIFKMTTAGATVWTKAVTAAQGYFPQEGLVFGADGNLYGTAHWGCANGQGGIFRVTPAGAVTTVFSFNGANGSNAYAPLLLGPDNKLYGSDYTGNLFRFDGTNYQSLGALTTALGTTVVRGLANGSDGNFYGVATVGGAANGGTIFKLNTNFPGISGFSPAAAAAGQTVSITGSNFTTASAVTVNGAPAAFTIVDDTYINVTVPAGAALSGNIAVTASGVTAARGTFTLVGPVTTLAIAAPATAIAGTAFTLTVSAHDQNGLTNTTYTGAVHFSSDDPTAILPADASLANGTGTFSATFKTGTHVTIRARDIATSTITGTAGVDVSSAPATHLLITSPSSSNAGTAFYVTVTAKDQYENVVKGYTGALHFTSTDAQATLPADTVLTGGSKQYIVKLKAPGAQTVTVTDTSNGALTVTTNPITVGVIASKLVVTAPAAATAGGPLTVTVTAMDASGNTATSYSGIVHITSTDAQAVLPADATLTNGVGTFSVTLKTAASQTITATDTVTASIKGAKSGIVVSAAAASQLLISAPATATHNVAIYPVLTVKDAYGNLAKGYTGTLQITSTDPLAVYPATLTLTNGTKPLSIRFKTLGNQTFTATDTVNGALTATSPSITIN